MKITLKRQPAGNYHGVVLLMAQKPIYRAIPKNKHDPTRVRKLSDFKKIGNPTV
jgi:hypothetical protein